MRDWVASDIKWMQQALALAARGIGFVEPNPPVGCVIVSQQGQLLGEGWHEKYGGAHAEVAALQHVKKSKHIAKGARVFVTLEPCCHQGKTPPCVQALIEAQVSEVIIAREDPTAKVNGKGVTRLRDAGIHVQVGL